jgi:DNA-binding YbaB/EbfC family protein
VKDLMNIMKQARELQGKVAEMQAELETMEVMGSSGGGLVTVTLNGKGAMVKLSVDKGLAKPDEIEILEDLIIAAHGDAKQKAEQAMQEKMASLTGGLPLPPGMKLF